VVNQQQRYPQDGFLHIVMIVFQKNIKFMDIEKIINGNIQIVKRTYLGGNSFKDDMGKTYVYLPLTYLSFPKNVPLFLKLDGILIKEWCPYAEDTEEI